MNIAQIKADNYKIFARQSEVNRAHNVVAVQYIEDMAAKAGINLVTWPIDELFKDKTKRSIHLIRARSEINRIFFEHLEVYKEQMGAERIDAQRRMKEMVAARTKLIRENQIQTKQANQREAIKSADRYLRESNSQVASAWMFHNEIIAIEGRSNNIVDELMEVTEAGFWQYYSLDGSILSLITTSDVIMTNINPSAGINTRVNFGQLMAQFDIGSFNLSVRKHARNISYDSYYHPHVSEGGNVCWGDAKNTYIKLVGEFKAKEIFALLSTLLQTYSPNNPYRSLEHFATKAPQDARLDPAKIEAEKKAAGVVDPPEEEDDQPLDADFAVVEDVGPQVNAGPGAQFYEQIRARQQDGTILQRMERSDLERREMLARAHLAEGGTTMTESDSFERALARMSPQDAQPLGQF